MKLTETDKNGNLICDLGKERTIKVFEKLHDTLGRVAVSSNANQQHDAFKNDRAIFFMHYVSSAYTRYRDNKSDFMIMPIPKYDESQSTYYSYVNTWANAFVGVPVNADTERAGVIMEAMAYLSHENLRPYVYDIAFKNKGARNEKDAEMLDVIFDTLYLDFNFSENFGGSLGIIGSAIFGEGNFASAYASAKDSINTAIETFSKTWTKSE